jgi:hypothetical protein
MQVTVEMHFSKKKYLHFYQGINNILGHAAAHLVESLRYKPGSISDYVVGIFH